MPPQKTWIAFCDRAFDDESLPGTANFPSTFAERSADFTTKHDPTYRENEGPDTLALYKDSLPAVLLVSQPTRCLQKPADPSPAQHEWHHFLIDPSEDVSLTHPVEDSSGETFHQRYAYTGGTALANEVGISKDYARLWTNADTSIMIDLGLYLLGNDWAADLAAKLKYGVAIIPGDTALDV